MAYRIRYTWQAKAAIESLDRDEHEGVVESIERLQDGPNPPGLPRVYKVQGNGDDIHVMQAGRQQRLRVVFTVRDPDEITVHDVISSSMVQDFRKSVAS